MAEIRIRAANADNDLEIREIIELFSDYYGDSFADQRVYDHGFWRSHIGPRFLSLIACDGNRVVGHLALEPNRQDRRNVELLYPALAPDLENPVELLGTPLSQIINTLASRKGWRLLHSALHAGYPTLLELARNALELIETAILPGYFPESASNEVNTARCSAILMQRNFPQYTEAEHPLAIHPPSEHLEFIKMLYAPLGMRREFVKNSENLGFVSDVQALERRYSKTLDLSFVYICPSLLSSFSDFDSSGTAREFIFINALDSKCPQFADALKTAGYSFCGLQALPNCSEALIYSKIQDGLEDLARANVRTGQVLDYLHFPLRSELRAKSDASSKRAIVQGNLAR